MKKIALFVCAALFTIGTAMAQQPTNNQQHQHGNGQCQHHCGNCPHHQQGRTAQAAQPAVNADGIAMEIVRAFPKVKSVKKESKYTSVYDGDKKLIGYAVYSKPASNGIKGYAGETPLMIALDKSKKVMSVELLPNSETPKYVQKVKEAGFFKQWNGLSCKKACNKKVDAVAGATYTSKAVAESLKAALKDIK